MGMERVWNHPHSEYNKYSNIDYSSTLVFDLQYIMYICDGYQTVIMKCTDPDVINCRPDYSIKSNVTINEL